MKNASYLHTFYYSYQNFKVSQTTCFLFQVGHINNFVGVKFDYCVSMNPLVALLEYPGCAQVFNMEYSLIHKARFFKGVLGTPFGSLELKIGSLESEKIINGSLESEKIGSLESHKSGPYRSIPGT